MSNLLVLPRLHSALPHPVAVVGYSRFCQENPSRQASLGVTAAIPKLAWRLSRNRKDHFLRASYARL